MGADIHGVLQVKVGGKWLTECEIEDSRNYWVFSALAGVRNYNDFRQLDDLRGLPGDLDLVNGDEVELRYGWCSAARKRHTAWMGDHSHTWYTLDEVLNWDGWDQKGPDGDSLREACQVFLKWCEYAKLKTDFWGGEARIVIGFDS